ncbi:hypothetical protein [Adlercreutzia sp. ZJ141]|uniref:hypothetical protein n=1 Tax=Adlercreutzia sp. ZJ141 TaxID=2709406 RepID=UPI0013EA57E2|nr:hypothetical protein [Adlercreutzia sp. ZJ141]
MGDPFFGQKPLSAQGKTAVRSVSLPYDSRCCVDDQHAIWSFCLAFGLAEHPAYNGASIMALRLLPRAV